LNILIISDEFPPFGGGAGVIAFQNAIELSHIGHDVTLLTNKVDKDMLRKLKGISIFTINAHPKLFLLGYKKQLENINLEGFDTIILNDMVSGFIAGRYLSESSLLKSIYFLHGSEPEEVTGRLRLYLKLIQFKKFFTRMLKEVNTIVAVSNYMKGKFLNSELQQYAGKEKVTVDYAGFPKLPSSENSVIHWLECEKRVVILSVGRVEKGKGFLDMYNIFKKLLTKNKGYIWVVVGKGSFEAEFRRIVAEDGLSKYIFFEGYVERNKLARYYKSADVFWLLSKYKEAFGLVYIEAQRYGLPVIGMNQYGVIEAVIDKVTGFLVDTPEDSLEILLELKFQNLKQDDIIEFSLGFVSNIERICEKVIHSSNVP